MKIKNLFIAELSYRVKILCVTSSKEADDELRALSTAVSELRYKSWVLENFVIGINQLISEWVNTYQGDKQSIDNLKEILYQNIITLNHFLKPENLYIDKNNYVTTTKNKCKLIRCHSWKEQTDDSNLGVLISGYDYERVVNSAINMQYSIAIDYWSVIPNANVYVRVFDESSMESLVKLYKPKTEEELKYFIILCCIDNFEQLLNDVMEPLSAQQLSIGQIVETLFDIAIIYNKFLDIDLKKFNALYKEYSLSANLSTQPDRVKKQKIRTLKAVPKNVLINLEKTLLSKIFGQDLAVKEVCKAIKKAYIGIKKPTTPIGAFLFYGPTSTGKTELAKLLAEELTGSSSGLLKVSCGGLAEAHGIYTLIGSPPGYIGYENSGFLEQSFKVTNSKFKVVLFDEVEKAHSKIFDVVLEMIEEGELLLSNGSILDISECLIIFTSNMGQAEANKASSIPGFHSGDSDKEKELRAYSQFENTLKSKLKPEFLARLNGKFYFKALSLENLYSVAKICLEKYVTFLKSKKIELVYDDTLLEYVVASCIKSKKDTIPHARDIRNFIEMEVLDKLGNYIIKECFDCTDISIYIGLIKSKLTFSYNK